LPKHMQEEALPGEGTGTALRTGARASPGLARRAAPRSTCPPSTSRPGTIKGEGGINLPRWSGAV